MKPAVVVISIDGFSAALFHDVSVRVPFQPADDSTQGDLVLHAAEGWYFSSHPTREGAAAAVSYRGTHGHRTDDPRLHAALLAAGPSIVENARTGVLDQLDVAPTVAAILGTKLPAAVRRAAPTVLRRP